MGLKYDDDDGYTFRLSQLDDSVYSDTGTVSSTYKQRIDSLFRDKRRQDSQLFSSPKPPPGPPPQQHQQQQQQQHQQQHIVRTANGVSPNPIQQEIERMFGGRDERQRAFHDVRTAVQAQIERLFADASSDPSTNNFKRTHSTKTPPLPIRSPEPPSPVPIIPPPLQLNEVSMTSPAAVVPAPQRYRHCESPPPVPSRRGSVSGSSIWSTGGTTRSSLSPSSDGGSVKSSASAATGTRPPSSSSSTSSSISSTPAPPTMKYRVDYLGALQLAERATSLNVLQVPLKDMYYKYRFGISKGHKPHSSTLQITEAGLKIANGPNGSDLVNPFPTIAVWAAVKLVIRKEMGERGHVVHTYAFLPLICDPEAQDKYSLYHPLNVTDPNVMAGMTHPPMFACVMRKVGVPKILECHGFVCQSAEDAIVIAANLYQALLENMKTEVASELSDPRDDERTVMSDSEMAPVRPPRRKRSTSSSNHHVERGKHSPPRLRRANSEDLLQTHIIVDDPIRMSKRRLKRSVSDRNFSGTFLGDTGDVYTKVALPRSKSFMNVTNKYNFQDLVDDVKRKTGLKSVDDLLKQVINPKGMSFSEMDPEQREILLKLALTLSKDEIYQRSKSILRKHRGRSSSLMSLIDSDSDSSTISSVLKATKRSFSRLGSRASSLQPSYLKDKSPLRRLVSSKKGYSFERVHQGNTRERENDFSHFLEQGGSGTANGRKMPKTPMPKRSSSHSEQSYMSCSECGYDSECSSKCYCSLPRRSSPSTRSHLSGTSSQSGSLSTNRKGSHGHGGMLRQSGIVNNNPCECDTESCAESEKCYCSLKRVKKDGLKMYEINLDSETDTNTATTGRSCDYKRHYGSQSNLSDVGSQLTSWQRMPNTGGSSSSAARNKSSASYLTEQSKSRSAGTVFSLHPEAMRKKSLSSNLSSDSEASVLQQRVSSGGSGYHSQDSGRRRESCLHVGSTESLLNSPRLRRHPSGSMGSGGSRGSRGSGDSRGSSSDGIVIENGSQRSRGSQGSHASNSSQQKILLVSAVDPSGKVVYRGASQKQQREGSDTASILSMKKTAEIAALFSELKLNQTTDLIDHLNVSASESEDDAYSSMQANNSFLFSDSNIENSLGYLP